MSWQPVFSLFMILVLDIVAPVTAIMRPEQRERILKIVSVNLFRISTCGFLQWARQLDWKTGVT